VEVKVVEVDLAVEVDGLRAAAEYSTHVDCMRREKEIGGCLNLDSTRQAKS
jgi:hypothetical protein